MKRSIIIFASLVLAFPLMAFAQTEESAVRETNKDIRVETIPQKQKTLGTLREKLQSKKTEIEIKEKIDQKAARPAETKNGETRLRAEKKLRNENASPREVKATEESRAQTLRKDGRPAAEERAERAEEERQKVLEKRQERMRAYFEKMFKRFDAALDRLETLASRIESRIEKFEKAGATAPRAKELLSQARERIREAEVSLTEAKASVEEVVTGNNPKETFEKVRTIVHSVSTKIKEAHRALVDVVVALKGASSANVKEDAETGN